MKKILAKIKYFSIAGLLAVPNFCFALNKQTLNNETSQVDGFGGGITTGTNNGLTYLKYTVWAAAVIGILAVAFMLFANVQETLLKTVMRVVAVICVLAMAFVVPGWFNLTINELSYLSHVVK